MRDADGDRWEYCVNYRSFEGEESASVTSVICLRFVKGSSVIVTVRLLCVRGHRADRLLEK